MAELLENLLAELGISVLQMRVLLRGSEMPEGILVRVQKAGIDPMYPRGENFFAAAESMSPEQGTAFGPHHLAWIQQRRHMGVGDRMDEQCLFLTPHGMQVADRLRTCMERESMNNGNGFQQEVA